jgi:hypothetical protein
MKATRLLASTVLISIICLSASAADSVPTPASQVRPTLTGNIRNDFGEAISGARVYIYTAKPKVGPAFLCPSCYLDCGKQAVSDSAGEFSITNLDPSLLFRILVVKRGYLAEFVADVDPADSPAELRLLQFDLNDVPTDQLVSGRVVDAHGDPIVGATISVEGWGFGNGRFTWGPPARVMFTPLAVSDDEGKFIMAANQDLDIVDLEIVSRNFAPREFHEIPLGMAARDFKLTEGSSLKGRLMHESKPLAGKTVTIASTSRRTRTNFTTEVIATDTEGRFLFTNLPAGLRYHVTGEMASLGDLGITPIVTSSPLVNGRSFDIGDLNVEPGLTVSGRVVLQDGESVPPDTVLIVSHEKIWQGQDVILSGDGRFMIEGMHPGKISVSIRSLGFRFGSLNRSFSAMNGGRLLATLKSSVTNLELLLEAGRPDHSRRGLISGLPPSEFPASQPLRGIEALPTKEQAARVKLHVVEATSQDRIDHVQVTPGWSFNNSKTIWFPDQRRTIDLTTDEPVTIAKRSGPAFLKIEAEGFFPETVFVEGRYDQVVEVKLRPGLGVHGTVLTERGHPVPYCELVMTRPERRGSGYERIDLHFGQIADNGVSEPARTKTDIDGMFQFTPTNEIGPLVAVHPSGIAVFPVTENTKPISLRIKPWGRIDGVVEKAPAEDYSVSLQKTQPIDHPLAASNPGSSPQVVSRGKRLAQSFLFTSVLTPPNDEGQFSIGHVPPGKWWIALNKKVTSEHLPPGAYALSPVATKLLDVTPGETVAVELTPPAESISTD